MGVEVRPFGVRCNIACQYCYQNPERDAGNVLASYDLDKMRAAVEREGRAFTLLGGEPLLMPLGDLEKLWAWGLERFGHNSVQTNGVLIGDELLRLLFVDWPAWQRRNPSSMVLVLGVGIGALLGMLWLIRRGRRS